MTDTLWLVSEQLPGGTAHALVDDSGRVRAAGFGEAATLAARLGALDVQQATPAHAVAVALRAYAAGELAALDHLAVAQPGGEFRQRVWQALRGIEPGSPISYSELALRAGRPRAVRAAASACASNLIAIVVPCHRVVRSDGALGGYLFGLDAKRALLDHEAAAQVHSR